MGTIIPGNLRIFSAILQTATGGLALVKGYSHPSKMNSANRGGTVI